MNASELNRILAGLTAFEGPPPQLPDRIDWVELAGVAERHGLAPLLGYQLEYRWPGRFGAPGPIRERLLSSYQGVIGDNVYKLVQLKRLLSHRQLPDVIILGAASLADALYPHVAFRPVESLSLLVQRKDHDAALAAFAEVGFRGGAAEGRLSVSDGRLTVEVCSGLAGIAEGGRELEALFARKEPALPYGPHAFRLPPEEALLALVAELAAGSFYVARILFVDLREMILRAGAGRGLWETDGAALSIEHLSATAVDSALRRSLYCALGLLTAFFPDLEGAVRGLTPALPARRAALLQRLVVAPALDPTKKSSVRGAQSLRRVLLGL